MVTLRHSPSQYQLSEHDVDLQDTPPCTEAECLRKGKQATAKQMALDKLKRAAGIDNLSLDQFEVTQTGVSATGPHTPVEWRYETTLGNGDRARHWTLVVDLDSVPPGQTGNGPDRSHVGYSYWSTGYDPVARVNGHIFIEYVTASRS